MSYSPPLFARHWITLADGGSSTWLYAREASPRVWIFIEIIDMVDACGRDATKRWYASVSVVDLNTTSPNTLASAIQSCGWFEDMEPDTITPIMLAEVCHSYGAKSPMWDDSAGPVNEHNRHNNPGEEHRPFRTLRAAARREAESLLDTDTRDHLLDNKIVNQIGQTAREFANGTDGLWDVLRRIAADPNANASQRLVLKMYANAGQTLGAGPVPADIVTSGDSE